MVIEDDLDTVTAGRGIGMRLLKREIGLEVEREVI